MSENSDDNVEEAEEVFEDAVERDISNESDDKWDPKEALSEIKLVVDSVLSNHFEHGLQISLPWSHSSYYHALGSGCVLFIKACLTFENEEIAKAAEALKAAVEVSQKFRKNQGLGVSKMVWKTNYNLYTEDEVHSELVYAESLLLMALLTFIEDQSLISLVKAALRIRSCYLSYKECLQILAHRTWEDEELKAHFESGVKMGYGIFNVMISLLPPRIMKLLEFVGFSGNKELGLAMMQESYHLKGSLRQYLSGIILIVLHTFVSVILGIGEGDIALAIEISEELSARYPEGAIVLMLSGRAKVAAGEINEAVNLYQKCINSQSEWRPIQHICIWDMSWISAVRLNWAEAVSSMAVLREENKWAPAASTYLLASFKYQIMLEGHPEMKEEITELLRLVPTQQLKLAGRSVAMEKFAVRKSQNFFNTGKLVLPGIELLYVWNTLLWLKNRPELLNPMLSYIENQFNEVTLPTDDDNSPADEYCLLTALKGKCLQLMGYWLSAEDCFKEILCLEKRIQYDLYLAPFAAFELGVIALDQGMLKQAKEYIHQAKHDYSGYAVDSVLHFRLHAASYQINRKRKLLFPKESTPTPSPTPSPKSSPFSRHKKSTAFKFPESKLLEPEFSA